MARRGVAGPDRARLGKAWQVAARLGQPGLVKTPGGWRKYRQRDVDAFIDRHIEGDAA